MNARRATLALVLLAGFAPAGLRAQQGDIATTYRAAADSLIRGATSDSAAYRRLGLMVDTFGNRLSGSASLEATIDWVLDLMRADGLENVRGEPVMVPHWVRGIESAELVKPRAGKLVMLGLGGSVGTPKAGITAPVLVVTSFDDLQSRAADAKGKIVLFDAPFTEYEATRRIRTWERERGRPPSPVLAQTASALESEENRAIAAGCTEWIRKPVRLAAFRAVIARYAGRASQSSGDSAEIRIQALGPDYLDHRRLDVRTIQSALEKSDVTAIRQLGHKMSGTGGSYGFPRISEIGAALETAAGAQNAAAIRAQLDALSAYLKETGLVSDPDT